MMWNRVALLAVSTTALLMSLIVPDVAPAACMLTCPDDIRVVVPTIDHPAKVDYAVMSSGCTSIVQTQGLPSGSLFPVGTTFNSFAENGSSPSCTFKVEVVLPGRPAPTASTAGLATLALVLGGFGMWAARRRARPFR